MNGNRIRASAFLFLCILVTTFPWLLFAYERISAADLQQRGEIRVGHIRTAAGSVIDVHIMLGDVFHPRATRRDLGFDLVAMSYYFDPVRLDDVDVLFGNPLLYSALSYAARDEEEFDFFAANLVNAVFQSRDGVNCFAWDGALANCEGDQLVPYFWPAHGASGSSGPLGVRHLGAIPLFDPSVAFGTIPDEDLRRRLQTNLRVAVRRTLEQAANEVDPPPRSVAFAALGSTSHTGGDSPAFLNFREGYFTLLRAVEQSRPHTALDRVYLVGFGEHTGIFLEETLQALLAVADRFVVEDIMTGRWAGLMKGVTGLLLLGISFLTYQNIQDIVRRRNRWVVSATILTVTASLTAFVWSMALVVADVLPEFPKVVLTSYSAAALAAVWSVLWASKRLRIPDTLSNPRRRRRRLGTTTQP